MVNSPVYRSAMRLSYEDDGDTSRICCFCLFCDGGQRQVYEEDEALLCTGDLHSSVSDNHDFGFSWWGSLITAIPAIADDDMTQQPYTYSQQHRLNEF